VAWPDLRLVRPLLDVPRAQIEAYCRRHGLQTRFDRSNLDTTFFRNWLRHEVLPLLAEHNPAVRDVIRRSARVIAGDYALLRALLEEAWPRVVLAEDPDADAEAGRIVFDLAAWRGLSLSLQRATLREAVRRLRRSLRNINFVHIENALEVARDGVTGQGATLPANLMLTLDYDRIVVAGAGRGEPLPDRPGLDPGDDPLPVAVPGMTALPGGPWALEAAIVPRGDLEPGWARNRDPWRGYLDLDRVGRSLWLRTRRPGDRFQPLGLGGHRVKLAGFLTNQKVPRRLRDRLPLLAGPGGIVWVCGQRLDHRARLTDATARVLRLRFLRPGSD
jgi:tRNA(Ile)-lysidine synthase